jgi:hypothetical protein
MARLRARIASITLADAHKVGDRGKVDAFGLFTNLGVWGLPAQREFSVIACAEQVSAGKNAVAIWLRTPNRTLTRVGHGNFTHPKQGDPSSVIAHRIHLQFAKTGVHQIGMTLGDADTPRNAIWFLLKVYELPWPALPTGQQLKSILADPTTIKSARAVLECGKCKSTYVFEIRLDPDALPTDKSLPFPTSGVFRCPKCGTEHPLRDVEGQMRSQLGRQLHPTQSQV